MSRIKAYRQSLVLIVTLGLIVAACTPTEAPFVGTTDDPSPATSVPSTPTPATSPVPVETAAATPAPAPIDYDYDYDYDYGYGGDTTPPSMATPAVSPQPAGALLSIAHDAAHAEYLVGPERLALYIFTQDSAGESNCRGTCAQTWPPLVVEDEDMLSAGAGVSGALALIERPNGSLQVTYNDSPLYHYVGDTAPGHTAGDGLGGVWFLARP